MHLVEYDYYQEVCLSFSLKTFWYLFPILPLQEFRKEVEGQQQNKTKVSNLGTLLMRSRRSNATDLQERLDYIENQWLLLLADIPNTEENLHMVQMELLPSRQALNELMLWMDTIENALLEDHGKPLRKLEDIQDILHKYRVRHLLLLIHIVDTGTLYSEAYLMA